MMKISVFHQNQFVLEDVEDIGVSNRAEEVNIIA